MVYGQDLNCLWYIMPADNSLYITASFLYFTSESLYDMLYVVDAGG